MSYITGLSPAINAAIAKKRLEQQGPDTTTSPPAAPRPAAVPPGNAQFAGGQPTGMQSDHQQDSHSRSVPVSIRQIERESAAQVENAERLARDVNALGTSGGYVTQVMRDELKQTLTDIEGGNAALANQVLAQVDSGVSVGEARLLARQTPLTEEQPPPLSPVDEAVEQLNSALDRRDGATHIYAQEQYTADVETARENLQQVIREEVDATTAPGPYFGPATLDDKREAARSVVDDYHSDPSLERELNRAIDQVIIDVEVDDTANLLERHGNGDRAFLILRDRFDDLSPEAQQRLLEHDVVDGILNEVTQSATAPLEDITTSDLPYLNTSEALYNVEDLVTPIKNPDLAAAVVARVQPAFDQALVDHSNSEDGFGSLFGPYAQDDLVDRLGRISDAVVGADREAEIMSDLAAFAITGVRQTGTGYNYRLPDVASGSGLPLSLEIVNQLVAEGNGFEADYAIEKIAEDYQLYVSTGVQSTIADYAEHTAELNYLLSISPDELPPELVQEAVDNYLDGKDEKWHEELERLQSDITAAGANVLLMQQRLEQSPHSTDIARETLNAVVDSTDFQAVIQLALTADPDVFFNEQSAIDTFAALDLFDGLSLSNRVGSLSRQFSNAYIQNTLTRAITDIDSGDARTYAQASEALDNARPALYRIPGASRADVDQAISAFDTLLSNLEGTRGLDEAALGVAIEDAFTDFESNLGGISAFSADRPLGVSFRLFGVAAGFAAAGDSLVSFAEDPSWTGGITAAIDGLTLIQDGGQLLIEFGAVADDSRFATRFAASDGVGKLLGTAGLVLGAYGTINNIRDGNHATAAWGAVGLGGGALALFSSAAFAGPVGIAIGLIAFGGSFLGAKVDGSNKFTGEDAREFLEDLGFDEDAARSLADRSGDGHSPVPIFMAYGSAHGLSHEETIEWINGISKSDLDWMRDRLHHTLDRIDGDLDQFPEMSEPNIRPRREIMYNRAPESVARADTIFSLRGISLPS
ncbi:MAG: hypothetical protein AB8B87_21065 [Granulosicoccus sp.]